MKSLHKLYRKAFNNDNAELYFEVVIKILLIIVVGVITLKVSLFVLETTNGRAEETILDFFERGESMLTGINFAG